MTLGRVIAGVAAAGTAAAVYGDVVRPRLVHWGASDEEVAAPYPGVEVVPNGERGATMAVTVDTAQDGTLGTVWTTAAARVPARSTRSGRTSPSATTSSTGRGPVPWTPGRWRRSNRTDSSGSTG